MGKKILLLLGVFFTTISISAQIASVGKPHFDVQGPLYLRQNLYTLNKAENGWVIWGTRDVSTSQATINLSNINNALIQGGIGFANFNATDKKLYSPADGVLEWMTHNLASEHGFAVSHQGTKKVYLNTSGNSYLLGGNVGIGTAEPNAKLTIEGGTFNFNVTSNYGGDYPTDNANYDNVIAIGGIGAEAGLKIYKQNSGNSPTFLGGANYIDTYVFEMTDANGADPDGGILFGATGNDDVFENVMTIRGNKRVGIGTTTPTDMLTVAGNIHGQEVKVTVDAGADFVFNENYPIKKLEEVESFVKQNKHLPEIAPAAEMEANGIELGEMNIKLLQKIEELTLYLIEQNKKTKELEEEKAEVETKVESMMGLIKSQQTAIEELKKEINQLKTSH